MIDRFIRVKLRMQSLTRWNKNSQIRRSEVDIVVVIVETPPVTMPCPENGTSESGWKPVHMPLKLPRTWPKTADERIQRETRVIKRNFLVRARRIAPPD